MPRELVVFEEDTHGLELGRPDMFRRMLEFLDTYSRQGDREGQMPGFEFEERIDRPPQEVFAFFIDFERAAEWAPEITRVDRLTDGPIRVGARYREMRWTTKGEARIDMEVTAFDPPGRYSAAFDEGGYQATFNYMFTPDGDGTRVEMACIVHGAGARTLLAPLISWLLKRQDKLKLRNLKSAIEAA